jgi:hypothetical protein
MSIQPSARVAPVWAETAYSCFLALVEVLGQRLQAVGALLEIQLQQVARQAHAAGVVHRLGEVDRLGMGVGHGARR